MRSWILTLSLGTQMLAMTIAAAKEAPKTPSGPKDCANAANSRDCRDGHPMKGPFVGLGNYCRELGADPTICERPLARQEACAGAELAVRNLRPPFLETRVLFLGGSPGVCLLAARTDRGWYVEAPGDEISTSLLLANTDRYQSEVTSVESGPDGTLVERAVFVHWTATEKMPWIKKPLLEAWYECEERVTVCGIGASGVPSCTQPLPVGYTVYCRDEEDPSRKLRLPVPGVDYRFTVRIANGRLHLVAPGGRRIKETPLPGWEVVAFGAEGTVDERRSTTAPSLRLYFP